MRPPLQPRKYSPQPRVPRIGGGGNGDLRSLGDVLGQRIGLSRAASPLAAFGIGNEAQAAFVCAQYNQLLRETCGARFADHARAVTYRVREHDLVVEVMGGTIWATELRLRETAVLEAYHRKHTASGLRIARVRYVAARPEEQEIEPPAPTVAEQQAEEHEQLPADMLE